MPEDWTRYRLDGCVLERGPVTAPQIKLDAATLPPRVDLRPDCPPVEDQGPIGSCTANAVVGALEFLQRRDGLSHVDLSRLFVYFNARQLGECTDVDAGTCLSHVLAGVLAHGACEERLWPNAPDKVTEKPTPPCYENARQHQAIEFAMTPLGEPVMQALTRGLPVVFTTFMPRSYYDAAGATGTAPPPEAVTGEVDVGHCMLIVGYDLATEEWIARNSWGETWGEGGYFRIPFATLKAYSVADHFWVIGAISRKTGLELVGPSMAQAASSIAAAAPQQMRDRVRALRQTLRTEIADRIETSRQGFRDRLRGK